MTEPKDCRKAVILCGLSQSNDSCVFYEAGILGICKHKKFRKAAGGDGPYSWCNCKARMLSDAETAELFARLPKKEEAGNG
jgi:hypothetical protein